MNEEFLSLRRRLIEKEYSRLNPKQREAVLSTEGPLLILAGAGSGKTTVLVNRVANILKYGKAYSSDYVYREPTEEEMALLRAAVRGEPVDLGSVAELLSVDAAKPWQVLAITFTNKAAKELKERLVKMIGDEAEDIWAGTFHSTCVRILRAYGGELGYSSHFTIYDTDDSKRVLKEALKSLQLDEKAYNPKFVLSEISKAKDAMLTPDEYIEQFGALYSNKVIGQIYKAYQTRLVQADAMDFDDLIVNTVRLLRTNQDARERYQRQFRYVMVDEYQDTSIVQYQLVALLGGGRNNIGVVGDDDQSIYKFRGATIENILSFEKSFKSAKVIRLEQNYRSTQNILDAANAVIAQNVNRKGKNLWTENGPGDRIRIRSAENDYNEAAYIANTVLSYVGKGESYSDFAVLYRTNSQSNLIEQTFVRNAIPYRMVGGHKFYDRKEVKDVIAYLSVIVNPNDTVRLERIINEPKRGIGTTSVNTAKDIAATMGVSLFEIMKESGDIPALSRVSKKFLEFTAMIEGLIEDSETLTPNELFNKLLTVTGYYDGLHSDPATETERKENLAEFGNNLLRFAKENEGGELQDFLEEVALLSDIDSYNASADAVVMMTIHSAKGLEFPNVFLTGMEESLFPSQQSMYDAADIEEERRLAYVGITRAKKRLFLTRAVSRMTYGQTKFNPPSRFIEEIPENLVEHEEQKKRNTSPYGGSSYSSAPRSYGGSFDRPKSASAQSRPKPPVKVDNTPTGKGVVFNVGDAVKHGTFGEGVVLSVRPSGGDCLLEVAFEKAGTKKIMANFAKIQKI